MDYKVPDGTPLGNKILIKMLPKKEKTKGGIIIADVAPNPLVEAIVINVGPDVKAVKPLDKLLVPNGAGVEHELEGVKYKFIAETDPFYKL